MISGVERRIRPPPSRFCKSLDAQATKLTVQGLPPSQGKDCWDESRVFSLNVDRDLDRSGQPMGGPSGRLFAGSEGSPVKEPILGEKGIQPDGPDPQQRLSPLCRQTDIKCRRGNQRRTDIPLTSITVKKRTEALVLALKNSIRLWVSSSRSWVLNYPEKGNSVVRLTHGHTFQDLQRLPKPQVVRNLHSR